MGRPTVTPLFVAKLVPLAALLVVAGAALAPGAQATGAYCPDPAHAQPQPVPPALRAQVAKAFEIDAAAAASAAFVRCDGTTLLACYVGANLVCGKADTRRVMPAANAWCRKNPGAQFIPMYVTGHATIYDWSCAKGRAVAGKIVQPVDAHGYIAGNWKKVP